MGLVTIISKKILFWNYSRTSWQWDVLCVLILVFIFLTPKSWFANSAYQRTHALQTTVFVRADVVGVQLDRYQIEMRGKQRANRPQGQVLDVREMQDNAHKVIGYEVDIR
jgi:hypothetical protein